MTDEMYERLNNYLNTIFIELDKTDKIFINNLYHFFIINCMIDEKFRDAKIVNVSKENKLTFNDVYLLGREIIEKINPKYLNDYDSLIETGELDFSFENYYNDSVCISMYKNDQVVKKIINLNREFNYNDVVSLIHEFIHYTNSKNKISFNRYFFGEFISIYFEIFALNYILNIKKVPYEELNINSRIISLFRHNNDLYKYIVILLTYNNIGNINKDTMKEANIVFNGLKDDFYEKECLTFLKKCDYINENNFKEDISKKMKELVSYAYKYIIGTLLAYYAHKHCKLEDMVKLNDNINTIDNPEFSINTVLDTIGIEFNLKTIDEALEIIKDSIYEFDMEKVK